MKYAVVLALGAAWECVPLPIGGVAIEQHVIIDYVARRMSVVRDATRSVVEMAAPDNIADMIGGSAATSFVRRGEATVAGRGCAEWQTLDRAPR